MRSAGTARRARRLIRSPAAASTAACSIMAPTTADHRYFNEDVNGLCLWEDMGKYLGVPTPGITTVINMASIVRDIDFRSIMTKSVKSLGLDIFPADELGDRI